MLVRKTEKWPYTAPGVSILTSYKGKPPVKKMSHFQWTYRKLSQIYKKLRSDQMDPKYALRGLKPIARTGRSLLKNWSYISNPCIYFSILLGWRAHLAKTLFILHSGTNGIALQINKDQRCTISFSDKKPQLCHLFFFLATLLKADKGR